MSNLNNILAARDSNVGRSDELMNRLQNYRQYVWVKQMNVKVSEGLTGGDMRCGSSETPS